MDTLLQCFPRAAMLVDDTLTVLAANARAAALFGLPGGDGGSHRNGDLTAALATETGLGDELALATAKLSGAAAEDVFDWRHQERVYEVAICPERAEHAARARFFVFFLDVTEQRAMERIHLEARHYLEGILADIPLGIAVLDGGQRVTFANRRMRDISRRLGGRGDLMDIIGADVADLGLAAGQAWRALCARSTAESRAVEGERQCLLEGDLVIATQAHPLHGPRGRPTGAILVVEDVTRQSRLETELIRMEKLATVGQMVITVNHEINNPLVIISTHAQALRLMNKSLDDKSRAKLEKIEAQVKRIAEVTERLRTMDDVVASEYIANGPAMVDIWGRRAADAGSGPHPADGEGR